MEVAKQNGCLRARDDQNDENEKEESIHVIDVRWPNGVQYEEQLDEDATKGQNATHDDPGNGLFQKKTRIDM